MKKDNFKFLGTSWISILFWLYIFYLSNRPNHDTPPMLAPFVFLLPVVAFIAAILSVKASKNILSIVTLASSSIVIFYLIWIFVGNNL